MTDFAGNSLQTRQALERRMLIQGALVRWQIDIDNSVEQK